MSAPPARAPPPPADDEPTDGASSNERLLAAAKTDNEELLEAAFADPDCNVNWQDGLGNTALHYAIMNASTTVLEHILCHEQCDVDLQNKLERDTPLHLAVKTEEDEREGLRLYLVETLVEAGANPLIKNKHALRPIDTLPPPPPPARRGAPVPQAEGDDTEAVRALLRRAEAEMALGGAGNGDIASDDDLIDADDIASD
ncbi:hypothetical protein NliqN6_6735 [Naganishia liquefaciens]|uniref:Ankyrin repeat domain-containing protein n=1 Tax=Naganishia liquefaciens TaxID=104408 RepID=A0A8H3U0P7_9TREE|nr:hypothetical protein NliqN6_6735 [Naganishia liquefaciens]